MKDYLTILKEIKNEIVISKSIFITQIIPIKSEIDAQNFLISIKKEHYKATHHCYAYILGEDQNFLKCSDDGEPSGTAGKPILTVLQHNQLTDIIAVVTRYFGGVKLGANGLVRAYTQSTGTALQNAQIIKKQVCNIIRFNSDYAFLSKLQTYLLKDRLKIKDTIFSDEVSTFVYVPLAMTQKLIENIYDFSNGICKGIIQELVYIDVIEKENIHHD